MQRCWSRSEEPSWEVRRDDDDGSDEDEDDSSVAPEKG